MESNQVNNPFSPAVFFCISFIENRMKKVEQRSDQSIDFCCRYPGSRRFRGRVIPPLHFMIFRSIINSCSGSIAQLG